MKKFELSPEALASGLRMGKNERISDEDRDAALGNEDSKLRAKMRSEKYDSPSVVDQYRDFETHPEAKAIPVTADRKLKEKDLPEIASSTSSSDAGVEDTSSNTRLGRMVDRLGGSRVGFTLPDISNRKGGIIKKMKKGGAVKASKRGDGIAQRGKTKGRLL
jgi:hypothetical protein